MKEGGLARDLRDDYRAVGRLTPDRRRLGNVLFNATS